MVEGKRKCVWYRGFFEELTCTVVWITNVYNYKSLSHFNTNVGRKEAKIIICIVCPILYLYPLNIELHANINYQ